jgi:dTDP-glucose pyrophosphorylase
MKNKQSYPLGTCIEHSLSESEWMMCVLGLRSTIHQVIDSLNKSGLQIVLIVDENKRLIGTVSDGDIRRSLISGWRLEDSIAEVYNAKPIVIGALDSIENVYVLMQLHKLHQIPLVSHNFTLVGLCVLDRIVSEHKKTAIPNTIVIMAGGEGIRLRPYTENCPKPMIKIGNKPILEHIIERAKLQGFFNFVLCVNYLGELIEEYFGDGSKFGVNIKYIKEKRKLGTAGALKNLEGLQEAFLVTNGDILTEINYSAIFKVHADSMADATVAIHNHHWQNPFGVVDVKNQNIVNIVEKPVITSKIISGIYVLNQKTLEQLEVDVHTDMTEFLQNLIDKKYNVKAYLAYEPWLDIGRPDDLNEANKRIERGVIK